MMERTMIKRNVMILLLMVLLINSCSKEEVAITPTPSEEPNRVEILPEPDTDLSPWTEAKINWRQFEGTHLSVLAAGHGPFPAIKPLLPVFEKLTGIRVDYQMLDESEMRSNRQIDLSSGGAVYDVIPIGVTYVGEAHAEQWLTDLNPLISDSSLTDRNWYDSEDIGKAYWELMKKEEQMLAIPFSSASLIFLYRKDLFHQYNIPIPDTYEDIITMKKQLDTALKNDGRNDIHSFATRARIGAGRNTWTVLPCIRSYGGDVFNENWQTVINSPQAVKAVETYRDMITGPGTPEGSKSIGIYEMNNLFAEGKLASALVASDSFNHFNTLEKSPIWDKWDAALPPKGPHSRQTSLWAWGMSINNASASKKAAWLFIQWVSSAPTIQLMETNISPTRLSAWESKAFRDLNVPGLLKTVKWTFINATPSPLQTGIIEFPQVGKVISMAFSEIFHGSPAQESLDKAVIIVDDIMRNGPTLNSSEKKE